MRVINKWNLIGAISVAFLVALMSSLMASAQDTIMISCTAVEYNADTSAYDLTIELSVPAGTQADTVQIIADYPQSHTPSAVVNVGNFALSTFNTSIAGPPDYYAVNAGRNAAQGAIDGESLEIMVMSLAGAEVAAGTSVLQFRNNSAADESGTLAYLTGALLPVTTENCVLESDPTSVGMSDMSTVNMLIGSTDILLAVTVVVVLMTVGAMVTRREN